MLSLVQAENDKNNCQVKITFNIKTCPIKRMLDPKNLNFTKEDSFKKLFLNKEYPNNTNETNSMISSKFFVSFSFCFLHYVMYDVACFKYD